jgi:DNA-binding transcriptional regulator YiaG
MSAARSNDTAVLDGRHVLRSDERKPMAKASLPEIRKTDQDEWREQIGRAIRTVRGEQSLKEFAAAIDRDERTVARWEDGKERPQLDAIFAVRAFRNPLIEAIARLSDDIEVETVIRIRRSA